jgi:hypothetical protein
MKRYGGARLVDPLKGNPNLDVRTGALVEKIIIEDGGPLGWPSASAKARSNCAQRQESSAARGPGVSPHLPRDAARLMHRIAGTRRCRIGAGARDRSTSTIMMMMRWKPAFAKYRTPFTNPVGTCRMKPNVDDVDYA